MALDEDDKKTIGSMITDAIGGLLKSGAVEVEEDGEPAPAAKKTAAKRPTTPARAARAAEDDEIRGQVEAALAQIHTDQERSKAEEEREARLAALEEQAAQREDKPVNMRRITKALWGGGQE